MIKDIPALIENICKQIKERTDIAVVGMSGGADSTLVAILCREALGLENVYGCHLPYSRTDYDKFNNNSMNVANRLGLNQRWADISGPVDMCEKAILEKYRAGFGNAGSIGISQVNKGNMKSRMRMICLYTINCQIAEETDKRCRVIGSGNLSEDYIGYDTKGGDSLCDFFPIGQCLKSEVYQLLDYFRDRGDIIENMIDRHPSAGLWDNQFDEDELGHTYNEMEPSILRCLTGIQDLNNPTDKFVWERHLANKHKHEACPALDLGDFRK